MFSFPGCVLRHSRLILAACFCLVLLGCANGPFQSQSSQPQRGGRQGQGQQVVSVDVATAEQRDMPVVLAGLGSIEAFNTVTVKSRLDGELVEVRFKEGQEVKQGDVLAVIDPRPYQVQLSQAEANLFKDQAALQDAKLNLDRFQDLYKNGGVISKQQLDTQGSQVGQLDGAVRADQAQIDNVKLQLVYTRITSPISGRIGLRLVDVGNIVHAADPNGLLVITQLEPIAAVFTLPEDNLPSIAPRMRKGPLQVDAYSRDDQTKLSTGKLVTIDNQIDASTGTGKLKAVFDNRDRSLWPNQFVNIHLQLEVRKNNTVVPVAAVQRGPQGAYVFTVKSDKKAEMRPVSVGLTAGNYAAIDKGLSPGEMVVTDGQDKLQTNTQVEFRGSGGGGSGPRADRLHAVKP